MNQKGLVPVILLLVLVVVSVVAFGIWSQSSQKNNFLTSLKAPTGELEKKVGVTDSLAASVVKIFCENFFKGPPALNDVGVMRALDLLSQRAIKSISTIGPSPSAALTYFAGVQDIPNQGFTIDEVSKEGDKATVKTTWKYSSGSVKKVFSLVKENGSWKIDFIN